MGSRNLNELPWKQWHPTKNGELTPGDVSDGSNKRVWWQCGLGHDWQTAVYYRVAKSSRCPYCVGQKVLKGFNDLATTFPDIAKQWHPTRNAPVSPEQISAGSEKKFWWICDLGHEWDSQPSNRTRVGSGCPVCDGKRASPGYNDLASQFPTIAKEWSPRNHLSPAEVVAGSGKNVWWRCSKGHEWEQKPVVRTRMKTNCPICSNQKIISGINDLEHLEPELAKQWHQEKNGKLLPSQVSVGSEKKAWWLCDEGHEWQAAISSRRTRGCPVCANRKVVVGTNDLSTTHPEIAAEWHLEKNAGLSPSEVALGQTLSLWWKCSDGHEWKSTLETRAKSGCPRCAKFGFDQSADSDLYFIENSKLGAWKIGITGSDRRYDRLSSYEKKGWKIIHRLRGHKGQVVRAAELQLLRWIRKDLQFPPFLDKRTMGKDGGASETFAIVEELKEEIISRMESEVRRASSQMPSALSEGHEEIHLRD